MTFDNLLIERDGRVAVLTINRPKVLNAMNAATLDELARAFHELGEDPAIKFLSSLPGTPVDEVPVGARVEVDFQEVAPGQLIHEWRVVP